MAHGIGRIRLCGASEIQGHPLTLTSSPQEDGWWFGWWLAAVLLCAALLGRRGPR